MKLRSFRIQTLSGQLLVPFICIILLFSLVNGLLFSFFQSKLQRDIEASNRNLLSGTADRYETHLAQLKTLLTQIYNESTVREFNRQLRTFGKEGANYLSAYRISNLLRKDAYNPLLHLEGLIVHYGMGDFAVDQDGSSSAADLFGRAYASKLYTHSYWKEQLQKEQSVTILPAVHYEPSAELSGGHMLLPISFKLPGENYQTIALLNAEKAMEAFLGEAPERSFLIADEGRVLYRYGQAMGAADIPAFEASRDHMRLNDHDWFRTESASGLSFYMAVPTHTAAAELRHWFWWSALVFAATLVLAAFVSFYFSKRLKKPVDRLLAASMDGQASGTGNDSGIEEYALIERRIRELVREREDVKNKMNRHRSILTSFGYMSQLKNINEDLGEWKEFLSAEGSYDIVLYELRFRHDALVRLNVRPEQASLALREHIRAAASEICAEAHTFQIEHNQMMTVIRNGDSAAIADLLTRIKRLLDQNTSHCLATVAISSRFEHASQFSYAYEQVQALARQALLIEETVIVTSPRNLPELPHLSDAEESQLASSLQAGSSDTASEFIAAMLARMQKEQAAVQQYADFAAQMSEKITAPLLHAGAEPEQHIGWTLRSIRRNLSSCHTADKYKEQLNRLAETVVGSLSMQRITDEDPIVTRVMHLLETQFSGDISLDQIAGELNMSTAYLSTYIKEKTGTNFIDHLNGIRMSEAKKLLSGTPHPINEIGRQVGYQNVTSFNRMFKKIAGVSPSEYRRQQQQHANGKTG
ncbi:helix-turn-helix domain-containing protein [Paenibacillus sp. LHD-117]|uniref:helix-turn-helix domain-containing protein n=1 Tax=Paenibacillus sp. LHD-117 TaxID=3071412 RepID=UPI0027E12CF2|nr:helix-turn-helix domain-containing protein [Paenibacillus sp. LHD-117]MDQ6420721.1 helix-turn-helix domain-containing protein [Paenibacillus sp. LHD-117]